MRRYTLVDAFCRRRHLHTFLLEHLRVGADARTNPKPYIDALNVLVPALLARGAGPRRVLAAERTPAAGAYTRPLSSST